MQFIDRFGPIIACSTGAQSQAALAIIRLSGFPTLEALRIFFHHRGPIEPNRTYMTRICDPRENKIIDEIVMTYFQSPKSYTGEHMLELSVHGNHLNIDRILKLFCDQAPFSPAHPGEFTYRALMNKKLTLSQVEGLDLLLNASNEFALDQGVQILSGEIRRSFLALKEKFIKFRAAFELFTDFSEDIGEDMGKKQVKKTFADLFRDIKLLALRSGHHDGLKTPKICLIGPANAGKSTLFNTILEKERSIISHIPGTTRDYVHESLIYKGVTYKFIDTAGFQSKKTGFIEEEGIKKSKILSKESFFNILVLNSTLKKQFSTINLANEIEYDLLICTHLDKIPQKEQIKFLQNMFNPKHTLLTGLGPNEGITLFGPIEPLHKKEHIRDAIFGYVHEKFQKLSAKDVFLVQRQSVLIDKLYNYLLDLKPDLDHFEDVGILSSKVHTVQNQIDEIIGIVTADDVLDSVFSNFCIGK